MPTNTKSRTSATPDQIAMRDAWNEADRAFLERTPWRSFHPRPLHDPDPAEWALVHFIRTHRPLTMDMDLFVGQLDDEARSIFPAGLELLLHAGWLRRMGGFHASRPGSHGVYRINPELLAYAADPRQGSPQPPRDTNASRLDRPPLSCVIMFRMGLRG